MIRLGLFNGGLSNGHGFVWMNEAGTVISMEIYCRSGLCNKIAHPKAILEFGDNVCNASSLKIDCHYRISIGEKTRFGWNVTIMDSNLHRLKTKMVLGRGKDMIW